MSKKMRVRPRYVSPIRLASGQIGWFFQVPGWAKKAGCPLKSQPLGTERDAAWDHAEFVILPLLDSWRTGGLSDLVPERAPPGTFDWMVATFKRSAAWTSKLDQKTKNTHEIGFDLVGNYKLKDGRRLGALPLQAITTKVADRLYEAIAFVDDPVLDEKKKPVIGPNGEPVTVKRERRTTANHAMKSCRRAWNVVRRAEPDHVPAENPFSRMGLENKSKPTPTATYEELLTFVKVCDANNRASLGTAALVLWEWLQRVEHVFSALEVAHYRPKERPNNALVVHPKTGEEVWLPLFDEAGAALYPELMERLDEIKRGRISGLMLVRDWKDEEAGHPVPWVTQSGDLSYMGHEAKRLFRQAGLRGELSLTSFRHGGMTEMGDADLTDSQMRAISRHKTSKILPT